MKLLPLAFSWALLVCVSASAQWMLSGNENKVDLTSGAAVVIPGAPPDTLTLLDFSHFPPDVRHLDNIPNTVIGPPSNIAITPDGRLALVANSMKVDPATPTQLVPHTEIHLIDLASNPPRRIGEVHAGRQPSGISITRDGRHALVANRAEGTISVLAISGTQVTVAHTIPVCAPQESLSDVALHPNGTLALASAQKGGYLALLAKSGDQWQFTGRKLSVYGQPYRVVITPDGSVGLTAGQGMGNGPDSDALSVIDLTKEPFRTIDYIPIGIVPESLEVSPDGDLVAVVTMEGSNLAAGDPHYSRNGGVTLLKRKGPTFVKVQELPVGRIPEGVAFTPDGRHLIVQCHADRQLRILKIKRGRLQDIGLRMATTGMPSSLRATP